MPGAGSAGAATSPEITVAPSSRKRLACAAPCPCAAPVTTTTLPSNRPTRLPFPLFSQSNVGRRPTFDCENGKLLRLLRLRFRELGRDLDDLVFLAADELAPSAFEEDLCPRHVVARGGAIRVLEEARVHARITHDQRQAIEHTLVVHHWSHDVFGSIDHLQHVEP